MSETSQTSPRDSAERHTTASQKESTTPTPTARRPFDRVREAARKLIRKDRRAAEQKEPNIYPLF